MKARRTVISHALTHTLLLAAAFTGVACRDGADGDNDEAPATEPGSEQPAPVDPIQAAVEAAQVDPPHKDKPLGPPSKLPQVSPDVWQRAIEQRDRLPPATIGGEPSLSDAEGGFRALALPATGKWEYIGPRGAKFNGRVNGVAFAPSNTAIRYLASAEGGIWKTTNSGTSWQPLTDTMQWLATTAVAVHPQNSNIVLAGSGDFDNAWARRQTHGVMRSTDGGASWTPAGNISGAFAISALLFDRDDPNIALATQGRGLDLSGSILRSTDAGATWQYTDAPSGIWSDMETGARDSNGVRYIYAVGHHSGGLIWRSADRGATWVERQIPRLPSADITPIEVAASRREPRTVYVLAAPSAAYPDWNVYRSVDAGDTWEDISNGIHLGSDQGGYNVAIGAGGTTEDVVYACAQSGAMAYRRSVPSWTSLDMGHADCHGITMSPTNANQVLFANDGGVFEQIYNTSTKTWLSSARSHNAALGLTQLWNVATHPGDLNQVLGGTQDNGTMASLGNLATWANPFGCDGGFTAFNRVSPATAYGNCNGTILRSTNSGASFNSHGSVPRATSPLTGGGTVTSFIGTFALDPSDPNRVYGASDALYRFDQGTLSWQRLGTGFVLHESTRSLRGFFARVIAVAPSDPNILYVGSNDGTVTKVTNALSTNPTFTRISDNLPDWGIRPIESISVHPTNPHEILIGGDRSGQCEENVCGAGGLWRCPDTTSPWWHHADGRGTGLGLPEIGVFGIARDVDSPGNTWYVATLVGVFQTTDGGTSWSNATAPLGLPNVYARAIEVNPVTRYLTVGTHGRGIWRIRLAGGSLPDLSVTSFSMSPSAPKAGNQLRFSGTIRNNGSVATPGNVVHSLTFSVNGTVRSQSTNTTTSLGAGASRSQAAGNTWTATAGTHTLLVRVDDANRLSEGNEGNNTRSFTFTVAP